MQRKQVNLKYKFTHVPPVMRRGSHVLIALQNKKDQFILGAKDIYPQGICRLIGGGLKEGESPDQGMTRELEEETGLRLDPKQANQIAIIHLFSSDDNGRTYEFTTHMYHVITPKVIKPSGDLDGIKTLSRDQMKELVKKFRNLPTKLVHLSKIPGTEFRWSDYGKFYAQIHQLALDLTAK